MKLYYSLPLTDVRHVSLANKYFARLCHSKRLIDKYNNASKKAANTISFLAQDLYFLPEKLKVFIDLMRL